ncbi:hypothetical protein [Streptomyces sp. NPDC059909]|uniref:hypothetical protein n=1 Tax=Streptomyces sp. NPDC059909 TaxID=3346998 RepID=UPI0036565E1F
MGIESDQLVFDYLSRVGDLAQQHQLPSGTRMQLVSSLRNEIDRQRAKYDTDSPAAVRRILGRLGTPDEVVAAAAAPGQEGAGVSRGPVAVEEPRTAVPEQRSRSARRFSVRRGRTEKAASGPGSGSGPVQGASPPHLAGMDELGASGGEPDWWRVGPGESDIGGFVGGVEIAEILRPPRKDKDLDGAEDDEDGEEGEDSFTGASSGSSEESERRRGRLRFLRPGRRGLGNPLLLTAAALLVVGTILGSWLALGLGWLLAYASSTLSRTEAKWAVLGLPGAVAAGAAVWLWGRVNGRWGEPIPPGGDAMADALATAWPWVVRGAAVATALYLVWRARRK